MRSWREVRGSRCGFAGQKRQGTIHASLPALAFATGLCLRRPHLGHRAGGTSHQCVAAVGRLLAHQWPLGACRGGAALERRAGLEQLPHPNGPGVIRRQHREHMAQCQRGAGRVDVPGSTGCLQPGRLAGSSERSRSDGGRLREPLPPGRGDPPWHCYRTAHDRPRPIRFWARRLHLILRWGTGLVCLLLFPTLIPHALGQEGVWGGFAGRPVARSFAAVGVINNRIYVAGGFDGVNADNSLQDYYPPNLGWENRQSIFDSGVQARRYRGDRAAVIDGKLYLPGGWDDPVASSPRDTLLVYEPEGVVGWSKRAALPLPSGCGASGRPERPSVDFGVRCWRVYGCRSAPAAAALARLPRYQPSKRTTPMNAILGSAARVDSHRGLTAWTLASRAISWRSLAATALPS